ncbi:MAG TPA: DUF2206 domain-containing protein [Candidatus Paceibacterota bacterium]|nr:DUF2206 domain-containing protein [Candidatus Paceibacterota bacterium]
MNTRLKRLSFDIGVILLFGLLIFSRIPIISGVAGFIFLFFIPGLLLLRAFQYQLKEFWMRIVHIVSFSICFLLLGGLVINTSKPLFGVDYPLEIHFVLPILAIFLIGIAIFNYFKCPVGVIKFSIPVFKNFLSHFGLIIFPLLSIVGANVLNNGGSNYITMFLLGSIVAYVICLFTIKKNISTSRWASSIYFISLALLFMTSMRGWHITGYDIHQEFEVFQLTKNAMYWSMAHFQDPYNACLSITILPTIASQFIRIGDEYIYKFLFQVIFALMPVVVYFLFEYLSEKKFAFLGTLFFIGQVSFFQGMPSLIRQEFAMLLFGIIILSLFNQSLIKTNRFAILSFLGIGMVLSHYSTSYIAILIFGLAYLLNKISFWVTRWSRIKKLVPDVVFSSTISFFFIIFLVCSVLVWNTFITHTSNNFTNFIDQSSSNVSKIFTSDIITGAIDQTLYANSASVDLPTYITQATEYFKKKEPSLRYYNDQEISVQVISSAVFKQIPPLLGVKVKSFILLTFKYTKITLNNIFVVAGVLLLVYGWYRGKFKLSEFIWLSFSGFILLALFLLIPQALDQYNLERLYFQLLIFWGICGVYGGFSLIKTIKSKRASMFILACLYCIQFLFYSGFVFNITGGFPSIGLNNYGEDYDKFYTSTPEVAASLWFKNIYDNNSLIFTSNPGYHQLTAFSFISKGKIITETLPSIISKDSYVYLSYLNTLSGKGMYDNNGSEYAYTYPSKFLEANKNKIYDNKTAQIFK